MSGRIDALRGDALRGAVAAAQAARAERAETAAEGAAAQSVGRSRDLRDLMSVGAGRANGTANGHANASGMGGSVTRMTGGVTGANAANVSDVATANRGDVGNAGSAGTANAGGAGNAANAGKSTSATDAKAAKQARELAEAARQFEGIFVRSLLQNSPMAGKGDAYGDLAVSAMADAVTAGHGLGLGELIRRAVETSHNSLKERK